MPQELYFEDFYVGQKFHSLGQAKVTAEEIKEFGQKYDPQPFHLDEAAGENSFFKGLAASGWLTAAIVMRLRVQSVTVAGGMIGAGVEEMRWTLPVRPGDSLRTEIEVVGVRQSQSRKEYGVVRTRTLAFNQRNEVVMRSTVNFLAPLTIQSPSAFRRRTIEASRSTMTERASHPPDQVQASTRLSISRPPAATAISPRSSSSSTRARPRTSSISRSRPARTATSCRGRRRPLSASLRHRRSTSVPTSSPNQLSYPAYIPTTNRRILSQ